MCFAPRLSPTVHYCLTAARLLPRDGFVTLVGIVLVALAAFATSSRILHKPLGDAVVALAARPLGYGYFAAAFLCSAGAWRSAPRSCDTRIGRADAAARFAVGSLVNSLLPVWGALIRWALKAVSVEAAMTAGPSTVRPSITLAAIVERMAKQKLTSALVTRSDGTLVGLLRRADAEAALDAATDDPSASSKGKQGR